MSLLCDLLGDPGLCDEHRKLVCLLKPRILTPFPFGLSFIRSRIVITRPPAASILERAPALTLYAATLGDPITSPLPRSLPGTSIVSSSPAVLDSRLKFGSAQLLRLVSSLSATSRHSAAPVDLLCAFKSPIRAIKASLGFLLLLLL